MISYKGDTIFEIFLLVKRTIRLFLLRMRRNSYLEASGQKPNPAIRSSDLDFLYHNRGITLLSVYIVPVI